ncbi:MAG: 50S ribosomal protein L1 [Desulfurococcales archaeon]|nr:50S ribosomal protein L1 [Desulfurococcales archaeon]
MPVDRGEIVEAVGKALRIGRKRNFKQSVDIIVVLKDVDVKSPSGRLREIVVLPHKPGKLAKVCVVAEGDMEVRAKNIPGVEVINRQQLLEMRGNRKLAKKLAKRCYWVLVQAPLMGLAGGILGPALGPRGKAPTPVPPNANIEDLVERFRRSIWVRIRNQPQVMARVGTEDMSVDELADNITAVVNAIEGKLGQGKIAKIYVKKTMGPPVQIVA